MPRCLGELVRKLHSRSSCLSQYKGEDWREYLLNNKRLTLFHDKTMTLRLVSLSKNSHHILPASDILLLQGELRILTGERIREGEVHKISVPVEAVCERESAHLEWEL